MPLLQQQPAIPRELDDIYQMFTNEIYAEEHKPWPDDIIHQAARVIAECGELMKTAIGVRSGNAGMGAARRVAIQLGAAATRFLVYAFRPKPKDDPPPTIPINEPKNPS